MTSSYTTVIRISGFIEYPLQLKLSRRRSTSTSEEEPDIDEADEERLQHTELYYIVKLVTNELSHHLIKMGFLMTVSFGHALFAPQTNKFIITSMVCLVLVRVSK